MKKQLKTIAVAATMALICLSSGSSAETIVLKSGTPIQVDILDTAGAHITVVEKGVTVIMTKRSLESYTYRGTLHLIAQSPAREEFETHTVIDGSETPNVDTTVYRDPDGYTPDDLHRKVGGFTGMLITGAALLGTGVTLFLTGASSVDQYGLLTEDGAKTLTIGIPFIASGAALLGVGIGKRIQYTKRLSKLNLSAEIGHDKGSLRVSYNF